MASVDLLKPQDWTFPIPIAYGPGRLREIAEHCHRVGISRPLIVTDQGSRQLPFIDQLLGYLKAAGLSTGIYSDISPNPRDEQIAAGRAQFRRGPLNNSRHSSLQSSRHSSLQSSRQSSHQKSGEGSHDGIIAIGGGSGMDGGKAICLTANNNCDLWVFNYDNDSPELPAQSFPPLICIPTTAGTGAETESTAMITDSQRLMKFCIWHPNLKPSLALLDPEITQNLPANLTAWTGCDAMIHAIEAYCVPDFHPLCDGAALEGLRLIYQWLPTAVADGKNIEARGAMLVGSCLAGVAFLKGLGLVHAISHMVGAEYDTHHGLTNAVALPAALRFNAPAIADKIPAMAAAMNLPDANFDTFYAAVCELLDQLEIPKNLTDIGVSIDDSVANGTALLAQKAHQDAAAATNPRPLSQTDIQTVIEQAIRHGR